MAFATAIPSTAQMAAKSFLHGSQPLAAAPMLTDCTRGAIDFFSSARVPATLVAGSALASIFALASNVAVEHLKKEEAILRRISAMMALYSFLLAVAVVVLTTTTSTALLLGRHDPMATDVYHFLKREFNFEFVVSRWSLLTSLLSFLISVCGRLLLEFRLFERKRLGATALLMMSSLVAFLMSHVNTSLNCWPNLGLMTVEVLQLVWARTNHPLTLAAVLFLGCGTTLGLYDIISSCFNPNVAKEDRIVATKEE